MLGPTWDEDVKNICATFGDKVCKENALLGETSQERPIARETTSVNNLVYWW